MVILFAVYNEEILCLQETLHGIYTSWEAKNELISSHIQNVDAQNLDKYIAIYTEVYIELIAV